MHIEGVSTGGSIALQFAIDHRYLVRRLVLVASACRLSPHGRDLQLRVARLMESGNPRRAWAALGRGAASSATAGMLAAGFMWLFGRMMSADDPTDMIRTIEEDTFDATGGLHRVAAPTLVIGGEKDRFYSPEIFGETVQGIPDAQLLLLAGESHVGAVTSKQGLRETLRFLRAGGANGRTVQGDGRTRRPADRQRRVGADCGASPLLTSRCKTGENQ